MSYLIKDLADSLRAARERKRLSQRALSEKAGLPQSHISRIENGVVDLQLSSLVELTRALELEVVLVPRKLVPMVQGLIRSKTPSLQDSQRMGKITRELEQIEKTIKEILSSHPEDKEYEGIYKIVKDLQFMSGSESELDLDLLKLISGGVKRLRKVDEPLLIRAITDELKGLRNRYMHQSGKLDKTRPAYSLDEDNNYG